MPQTDTTAVNGEEEHFDICQKQYKKRKEAVVSSLPLEESPGDVGKEKGDE